MQTKSTSNKIFYIIQGYPSSGKTSYHYKLQKTHCDKQINHMCYEDSITEFIEDGMSPLKAKYLVDQLTESNIFKNPDIYVLEDVRLQSDRHKIVQIAELLGYKIIVINFIKPKIVERKFYLEYAEWVIKTRKRNKMFDIKTKFPQDIKKAEFHLKLFDTLFEPLTKEEKDKYQVINVLSYIDIVDELVTMEN